MTATKTTEEVVEIAKSSRRQRTCAVCGAPKRTPDAFCMVCYTSLPRAVQGRFWGVNGRELFLGDYVRIYVHSYRWLNRRVESVTATIEDDGQL